MVNLAVAVVEEPAAVSKKKKNKKRKLEEASAQAKPVFDENFNPDALYVTFT